MAYITPHIILLDTTTQSIASANTIQAVTWDTNVLIVKGAHSTSTNPSRITINEAGNYFVQFAAQVTCTSGSNKTLDMWLRINGTDVANSNYKTKIVSANDESLLTIVAEVALTSGQYIEIMMSGDSTNLQLKATAAGSTPTRPVTPSINIIIEELA